MDCVTELDAFRRDRYGAPLATPSVLFWYARRNLRVISARGVVTADDMEVVTQAITDELAPGFEPFNSLVDMSAVARVDPEGFDAYVRTMKDNVEAFARVNVRSAYVQGAGNALATAAVAGYTRMLGEPFPTGTYATIESALAGLGFETEAAEIAEELVRLREEADRALEIARGDGSLPGSAMRALGLAELAGVPLPSTFASSGDLALLLERGLLERTNAGVGMTAAGARLARTANVPMSEVKAFAARLLDTEGDEIFRAGLRLALAVGDSEIAAARLDARWPELRSSLELAAIHPLIAGTRDEHLSSFRFRIAVALRDPRARELAAPDDLDYEDLLAHADYLHDMGDHERAAEVLSSLEGREDGSEEQRLRATLLSATRVLHVDGEPARAHQMLDSLQPSTMALQIWRGVLRAEVLAALDDLDAARAEVSKAVLLLERPFDGPRFAAAYVSSRLHDAGRPAAAALALTGHVGAGGARATGLTATLAALDGCDLETARREIDRLQDDAGTAAADGSAIRAAQLRLEVLVGHDDETLRAYAQVAASAEPPSLRDRIVHDWIDAAMLDAAPAEPSWTGGGEDARVALARHASRAGAQVDWSDDARRELSSLRRAPLWALARAEAEIVADDPAAAQSAAEALAVDFEERGQRVLHLAALECACDAALVAERPSAALVERFLAAAESTGSRRFLSDARFHALVAERAPAALSSVVSLASGCGSRRAARRLRALLGSEVPLDRVDQAVVEAIARRLTWCLAWSEAPAGDAEISSLVFLDETVKALHVGSQRFDLGTRAVLWRILDALAEGAGPVSKEDLVSRVWGVTEYHPLKHDNRLQANVSQLRKLVKPALGDSPFIVSKGAGYAFARPTARVVPRERSPRG